MCARIPLSDVESPKLTTFCRRVKCDERKPSCLRCVTTNRICEGYPVSLHQALSPDSSLKDEERRAFLFFRSQTAHLIFGHHDASRWLPIFLQLGHSEVPIKHALTALASLHESLEPSNACVSLRQSEKHAQITARILALRHYTAAIKSVQRKSPDMSSRPDIIMALCLLFICFEQLQSGDAACLVHLTAGLRLVSWWRSRTNTYNKLQEYSRPTLDLINNQITPILQRLRVQFSLCMDSRHALRNLGVPLCLPSPTIPFSYPSLDLARRDYDSAMNYIFSFLERGQSTDCPPTVPVTTVLRQWKEAVNSSDFSREPPMLRDCTRKLLELYYHVSIVIAETYEANSEAVFDNYTHHFQAIVDLAETITETWRNTAQEFNLLFSFDLGITPPMFLVASRSRHPLIRRKAADLILRSPIYRGAWRDRYSGLCAQRIIDIEEENAGIIGDEINVPETCRIRKISADLQEEGGQIMMRFTRWPFTPESPIYTTLVFLE